MSIESLYEQYRTGLFALAYRMTGSVMDAEDIVQDAFLAYGQKTDMEKVENERAYLYKIVTNRCLDLLRSSSKKRELYVGPWLPEPLLGDWKEEGDPSELYLRRETITTAYLLLLQQMNAVERAIFVLRELFGYSYEEIADMVGKSSPNCRQIFHRAQKSMQFDPEQLPTVSVAEAYISQFALAVAQGNTEKLLELVSDKVVMLSDGGGKVMAAQIPIVGFAKVLGLLRNLISMYDGKYTYAFQQVNGLPGMRFTIDGQRPYVYSFDIREGKIQAIYVVANPDKVKHIPL
ncbi:RNA polymerase sigma factor SigJ [Paenibacillus soyae]|uniref:RNA polymerase sigma factor SigJ n=1 Tax=Paenibacillus soyae TaxID=2969249 RepID=A0A9X2MUA3_9BACL|nr:RNA polymerase sigma factor SigJ [Paenibacillus soyae]MCR2806399.1 RNA polymerase sigma factor SigJ [Paenibacillus soyae]